MGKQLDRDGTRGKDPPKMKQLLQNLRTGEGTVADVPVPSVQGGRLLVRTVASLVSAGTERAFVELGQKNVLAKAKERPDLVRKTLEKIKTDGLLSTLENVRDKLNQPHAVGYSAAGIVMEVAPDVSEFRVGDRVACAGTGFASHAEVLSVPKNLCVRIPGALDFESAAFATVGAIALQGVRLAEPTLGESVVVIGLGLVGQLTVQLLKANGCRVFGIDLDQNKIQLARELGADDCALTESAADEVRSWSRGRGADAVIVTAATSSDEPIQLAGEISRLKGRVVAVGLVGMNVPRDVYYRRELSLKVSMSYGPGRYDPEYEERGHDYPYAYVRWTEGRNIEAFLDLVASGKVRVEPLITHRFPIENGEQAYRLISGETREPYLGIVFQYNYERELERSIVNPASASATQRERVERVGVGLIGAGAYAQKFLLPNLKQGGANFLSIATASGVTARDVGEKYGFARFLSEAKDVVCDNEVNLVVIATPHDAHARLTVLALEQGKNVFVEKPLALNDEELDQIIEVSNSSNAALMVGFNRRFSPLAIAAKDFFDGRRAPLSILYRINSGRVSRNHWTQDPQVGGGRIIGEVCHFVDLMQFLTGAPPVTVFAESVQGHNAESVDDDSVFITLKFADGSNGSIAYLAEGDKSVPKEYVEIYGEGKMFVLDDFRHASMHENGREKQTTLRNQDKGQARCVQVALKVVRDGEPAPIALTELISTTRTTFRVLDSLRTGEKVVIR
jgi:polar amino acid transport system substrate-binding protein